MKLLLVFNPRAAMGKAARLLPRIRFALEAFATLDVLRTRNQGDAVQLVAGSDLSAYDGLIAAGGDGTLFEVLNGLYRHEKQNRIPLGLVPVGTGNAFARDLGLVPGDWEPAVELIRSNRLKPVDVGQVESSSGIFYFLNIIGAGLPVDAMKIAEKLKFMGNSAYSIATLLCAMNLKSYRLSIEINGNKKFHDGMFIEVSNTRYTGTTFLIAPDAVIDDGMLDVVLLGRLSRLRLLRLFPTIYTGKHVRHKEITTFQASEIRISAPEGLTLAPDGELQGATPVSIRCLHRDLQMFRA